MPHLPLQRLQMPTQLQDRVGSLLSTEQQGQFFSTLLENLQLLLIGPDRALQRFPLSIHLRKQALEGISPIQSAPPYCMPTLCPLAGIGLHPCWQEPLTAATHE